MSESGANVILHHTAAGGDLLMDADNLTDILWVRLKGDDEPADETAQMLDRFRLGRMQITLSQWVQNILWKRSDLFEPTVLTYAQLQKSVRWLGADTLPDVQWHRKTKEPQS